MAAALVVAATLAWAADPASTGYAGTPLCVRCHIDFARQWQALPHSRKMSDEALPFERRGCEACHGPGAAHAAGQRRRIVAWGLLKAPEQSDICLKCHQKSVSAELWTASPHAPTVACTSCHEVHRPVKRQKLLRAEEGRDCTGCHSKLAEEIKAKRHHPLGDGALACAGCHQVHGSRQRFLLPKPQGETCQECHGDDVPRTAAHKRADFKLKHQADAKGHEAECRMCHDQQSFCDQCHATPLPHPKDFAMEHKAACQKTPGTCLKCHTATWCKQCHDKLPPPFEPAAKSEPGK